MNAGALLYVVGSKRPPCPTNRIRPITSLATDWAPITGLRAALRLPSLSAVHTTSGASTSSSAVMSPVVAAVKNRCVISVDTCGSTGS